MAKIGIGSHWGDVFGDFIHADDGALFVRSFDGTTHFVSKKAYDTLDYEAPTERMLPIATKTMAEASNDTQPECYLDVLSEDIIDLKDDPWW